MVRFTFVLAADLAGLAFRVVAAKFAARQIASLLAPCCRDFAPCLRQNPSLPPDREGGSNPLISAAISGDFEAKTKITPCSSPRAGRVGRSAGFEHAGDEDAAPGRARPHGAARRPSSSQPGPAGPLPLPRCGRGACHAGRLYSAAARVEVCAAARTAAACLATRVPS